MTQYDTQLFRYDTFYHLILVIDIVSSTSIYPCQYLNLATDRRCAFFSVFKGRKTEGVSELD